MNVLDLAQQKVNLKKVASTHGGEWQGPCPACGGNDRFHVWPENNNGKGGYWCRACEKSGDNIQFLIDFEGKTFKEVCEYLNITIKDRDGHNTASPREKTRPAFQPTEHQSPVQIWQERAEKFVSWAHENIKQNPEVMQWLADRGIDAEAVDRHRLGWNPGEKGKDLYRHRQTWGLPVEMNEKTGKPRKVWIPIGLTIPYTKEYHCEASPASRGNLILSVQIRRPENTRTEDHDDPYIPIKGSSSSTFILGPERKAFIIVESRLDAIACYEAQELAGAMATGSNTAKPDSTAFQILQNAVQILNVLDYGDTGGGGKSTARAIEWWKEQFPDKCERWPVPQGKDPGEAYRLGTDLSAWIKAGLPPSMLLEDKRERENVISSVARNLKDSSHAFGMTNSPLIAELYRLLKNNPGVKIINTPDRYTVLKNDRYVGGRINYLVMREQEIIDYIINHPAPEITYKNILREATP